jgi:hypothetical protein
VVVQDKMTKEVVLVASFKTFIGMKIEEYTSVQTLTKEFIKISSMLVKSETMALINEEVI